MRIQSRAGYSAAYDLWFTDADIYEHSDGADNDYGVAAISKRSGMVVVARRSIGF